MQKHGRARRGRRGQIMVILALAAVGLVGIAALGIDVFYIYWNKNKLQGGTDAAALAGARAGRSGWPSSTAPSKPSRRGAGR